MKLDDLSAHNHTAAVVALRATALVLTAAILWGTLWPTVSPPAVNILFADKLWHMSAFGVWAGVVAAGWSVQGWKVLAGAALVGAMIELLQPLVGRDAELADLGADLLGAAMGVWSARRLLSGIAVRKPGSGTDASA